MATKRTRPELMGRTPSSSLRSSALALACASGIEYLVQLTIPIVLVRAVDEQSFSQYRLLWLMASTALALAPAFMPQSLFYFLSRSELGARRFYIGNVVAYLALAGILAGIVFSDWNPVLPPLARLLFDRTDDLASIFVGLWVAAAILDTLPTADGRPIWQAKVSVVLAVSRALLLVLAALLGASIFWLALAMLVAATIRLCAAGAYILIYHGASTMVAARLSIFRSQFVYALPFALGNAMFLMRVQAGEWVAASMFEPALYAAFSIAAVVLPVATLIRQPVHNAMMPYLNAAHARGDTSEFARLVGRSNGAAALLLFPLAGVLMVTVPQLVDIVYTTRYKAAVPVMQLYLCIMMMNAFALGHVLPALNKGGFATANSALCLVLSFVLSLLGGKYWGLQGVALGSVLSFAASELASLLVVARSLGVAPSKLLPWGAIASTATATVFGIAVALGFATGFSGSPFLHLFINTAFYVLTFTCCFLILGGRRHLQLLRRAST